MNNIIKHNKKIKKKKKILYLSFFRFYNDCKSMILSLIFCRWDGQNKILYRSILRFRRFYILCAYLLFVSSTFERESSTGILYCTVLYTVRKVLADFTIQYVIDDAIVNKYRIDKNCSQMERNDWKFRHIELSNSVIS